jgi:hypothetical protein
VRPAHSVVSVVAFLVAGVLAWSPGCGAKNGDADAGAGSADGSSGGSSGGNNSSGVFILPDVSHCTINNQCITMCADSTKHTTISGTVYDPAGNNPLAGVAVYVPASLPLEALPKGASCGDCNTLYKNTVLASDISQADGTFHIIDAPSGASVPVVVQAGKWRKVYQVSVADCADNMMNTMKFSLPKSANDGMGANLPDIAISTGGLDSLECLLTRVGVDPAEYTGGPGGTGHIHIFQGGGGGANVPGPTTQGGSPASPTALWPSAASMLNYDVVLLSCEGGETSGANPTALSGYVQGGGRAFLSHFHYKWLTQAPLVQQGLGQILAGSYDTLNINAVVDTSFAQGQALHDWLALPQVAALTMDQLPIQQSRQNVASINDPPQKSWINSAPNVSMPAKPGLSQYFTFDVRVGEMVCGRIVYSDMHVGAASGDYGNSLVKTMSTQGGIVPTGCNATAKLSPQEAVLEYMLFDLSSCLTPVTMKKPPPTVPR